MDKEFFQQRIRELTTDKLINLLQKTSGEYDKVIFQLAREEAERRNVSFELINTIQDFGNKNNSNDQKKLRRWNWGAFLLAPIWSLANKLDKWAFLSFIPFVNIVAMFYLGYHGNRIAFKKSKMESVDDFIAIQNHWALWGVIFFCLGLISLIVNVVKD
jgi:hypothetical protein